MCYLHTSGSLQWKPGYTWGDLDSDFARSAWHISELTKTKAWEIAVEALSLGASIDEYRSKWELTDDNALHYASKIVKCDLFKDGNQWCATKRDFVNIQESPCGFGDTALDALAGLCKDLGFKGRGMWSHGFDSLVKVQA